MNRLLSCCVAVAGVTLLGACGSGDVQVVAELHREATADDPGGTIALRDLEVFLLPYDRDAIFDSLEATYPEREPPIPDALLELQAAISQAQEESQRQEMLWGQYRDSLQRLVTRMQSLNRTSAEYNVLFREHQPLETAYTNAERRRDQAFAEFTRLQSDFNAQSQEIKMVREAWADAAFADVDDVITARLKALRREEMADTTAAGGSARFRPKPGQWWVHARYPLPYDELYWNVPIEVVGGELLEVRLTRSNAQVRPRL